MQPLAIDLFCGLGGWTEGLLAEGYRVVGFDIEQHQYGDARYPGQLVIQDVLTLHGGQFKDAALIVASPPCQEYSYMAMPWTRAKQKALEYRDGTRDVKQLTALFDACFRIQREACEAAGRHIPLVVENVCGAQKWVGKARWHFGSFYLWGDVPALMPWTTRSHKIESPHLYLGDPRCAEGSANRARYEERRGIKVSTMGAGWYPPDHPKHRPGLAFNGHAERAIKNEVGSWFNIAHNTTSGKGQNPDGRLLSRDSAGIKQHGSGRDWYAGPGSIGGTTSSKSSARKAASAHIAKIPLPLSRHIARAWWPQ